MYLDILLIDLLTPDGVLTSYKVKPKQPAGRVVVDRLRDIWPERFAETDADVGGTRIYDARTCYIERHTARIRSFQLNEGDLCFDFQFEHMGIPVGPIDDAHRGYYNLLLAPGWRFREIRIVDPYDRKQNLIEKKRQFGYELFWDTKAKASVVEMELRSRRGSFSFVAHGTASLTLTDPEGASYADALEVEDAVSRLSGYPLPDDEGRRCLAEKIGEKADWLELKPSIFGLGVNLNQIISDSLASLKHRLAPR